MASHLTPQTPRFDVRLDSPATSVNPSIAVPPPPPPPQAARESNLPSPLRRNVPPPPALTTSVPTVSGGAYQSTPQSTTSLSSPFTLNQLSAHPASARPPSRGVSPMMQRMSAHFSVPYDPRDWASGMQRVDRSRHRDRGDDGIDSPPPPYLVSEASEGRGMTSSTFSPAESSFAGASSSYATTPNSTAPLTSPLSGGHQAQMRSGPRLSPAASSHQFMAPPPPQNAPRGLRVLRQSLQSHGQIMRSASTTLSPDSAAGPSNQDVLPPGARRAVSAGPTTPLESTPYNPMSAAPSRSTSRQRSWQPGMPLPGPPPGPPPPSASRSQSASSAGDRQSAPTGARRRPTRPSISAQISNLGPVPPTPADWVDDSLTQQSRQPPARSGGSHAAHTAAARGLHVDTSNLSSHRHSLQSADTNQTTASDRTTPDSAAALSRKVAVRDSSARGLRERRAQSRVISGQEAAALSALSISTNPWASAIGQTRDPHEADRDQTPNAMLSRSKTDSPATLLRYTNGLVAASPAQMNQTPPRSPFLSGPDSSKPSGANGVGSKTLPTPPLSQNAPISARSNLASEPLSAGSVQGNFDEFMHQAVQRHQRFLARERAATTDVERLQAFMDFVEEESLVRKERYFSAFEEGSFDVPAAKERLFTKSRVRRASGRSERVAANSAGPSPALSTPSQSRPETMWWKDYKPALSPIASMGYDEMSSRGRAPSRWWESQTGSQSDGMGHVIRRSKRESKYMGLSKELLISMEAGTDTPRQVETAQNYDSNGYPEEKVDPESFGYYDEDGSSIPSIQSKRPASPSLLDISRFITLPPPYPRHYPAVNNSHPDLAQYRTAVRTLSDLTDIHERKSRHQASAEALRKDHEVKLGEARRRFRASVQAQINDGSISFAEAAEAEKMLLADEHEKEKACLQAEFDTMQDVVVNPLHTMLNERMTQLDASITDLQRDLFTDAVNQDPDQPVQEGDERPELLEKLTQLKWLFETREQVHKELFELLSERNDAYKSIVLLPYRQSQNTEKLHDTESFFERDARNRQAAFCAESLRRHEDFLATVDDNTRRGIELQSSAFWDIAPGLLETAQKIPEDVTRVDMLIPEDEYNENPAYRDHPQQYLYSVLTHAEKSTYQFIEAQINLHCLVHEIKTSHLSARYRHLQVQSQLGNMSASDLESSRSREEATLTADLKTRASMIEEQWLDALGSQLHGTRERVKQVLQERGGWDDMEEDG